MDPCPKVEAPLSQHPTRALPLYLTNLHHNKQSNLSKCTPTNLIRALLTQPKLKPLLLTLCWQWSISPFTPLLMMLQTSPRFFQPRGLDRSKSVNTTSSSMPITPTISLWTVVSNGGLAGSDMRVIHKTDRKINISGIDNHEVTGLDVVTAATLLNNNLSGKSHWNLQ